ncbi:MAG: acyl-CoA thioesterase [Proteobacteria bacterium]|nr:acyl-CoA thioesterase [Pseudomonadota bacterium]
MRLFQDQYTVDEDSILIDDFPNPFSIRLTVVEENLDPLGHVNNAVYVNWIDQAHLAHCGALGMTAAIFRKIQSALVVRHTELDYLSASKLGDLIKIGTCIESCDGKLRLRRLFQVVRSEDGITILRGRIDYVSINLKNGKPRRMPPEFVEAFGLAAKGSLP